VDESRAIESVELRLVVGRLSRGNFLRGLESLAATAADTVTWREVRRGVFSSTFGVTVRAPKTELDHAVLGVRMLLQSASPD
jgi:hypothetical protein